MAVEFALVLPILVMLLLGIVTGGVSYSEAIGISNAVREGSRFGAIAPNDANWEPAVIARTRQTQFDDPSVESSVCAKLLRNSGASHAVPAQVLQSTSPCSATGTAPTAPAVDPGQCVAVVWASRPFTINIGITQFDGIVKRGAAARYERDC